MFRTHFGAFCALTVIIRSILGPFQGISGAMEVPPPFSPSRSPPNPSPALSVGRSTLCTSVISLAAPRAVASLPAALCAVRLGGSVVRAAVVKVTLTGTAAAGDCGGTGRALEGYWEHWEGNWVYWEGQRGSEELGVTGQSRKELKSNWAYWERSQEPLGAPSLAPV